MRAISEPPTKVDKAAFKSGFGQRFILTVDTEEEFDWSQPITRSDHSLDHIPRLAKFQQFCEKEGVCPIYLIDYPIATSPLAVEILREPLAAGRAEVGIQLHPWVNPPFDEDVNEKNSYAGNLPEKLEHEKFTNLRETIEKNFGVAPQIYRAGRYGVGENSGEMLHSSGVALDSSVRSKFDYSAHGGPNFQHHPLVPYWLDDRHTVLELPLTTVFWGMLRKQGDWIYPLVSRVPSLRGVLARTGLLERIPLTPEGVSAEEAIRGIDIALDDELPLLVFSFHSPSLAPGHTPYVRNEDELDRLYDWWRSIFSYLKRRNVKPTNQTGIMTAVEL